MERREVRLDVEELRDDALHQRAVEVPVRVGVLEVDPVQMAPQAVQPAELRVVLGLSLPGFCLQVGIALGIEAESLQLLLLVHNSILHRRPLLGQALVLLLAPIQDLLRTRDSLLEAGNGHRFCLFFSLHLLQPRLGGQELLAHGPTLPGVGRWGFGHTCRQGLHGPLCPLDLLLGGLIFLGKLLVLALLFLVDPLLLRELLPQIAHA
mmetsp:Transcript_16382/g.38795  ORF Transcript_16382/g.38795 Transcript_16382/m.38795 type:complete len:208 (-) Transcript_16382:1057-1680(-)